MTLPPINQTRISKRFAQLRESKELGLIAYITAGDPSLEATYNFVVALAEAGADIIELGVPFSDPLADGPTIQRASERALQAGASLAAPTSTDERLKIISACSSGFVYVISRTGVTGAKDALPDDLPALLRRARSFTELPIAVGFGISLPGHVSVLGGLADAAVVGSALVAEIEKATSIANAEKALREKIVALKDAGRRGLSRREAGS
jgi:tryptophan synthase alpha chain